ncbi:hypothetical protein G8T76_13610 [Clostridium botulinum C/D]|uniref:hypothetical protein n=1 Tax=Clostridium botulinum TaxID=1491 RepID=UPI00031F19D2|nr:hypothetical protein [Clostridium botulinum]KEH95751.1 hypothetical protein Y848_p0183 [Clostridium botulinum C/D str. Sp77]MCD3198808.1 hypothetical protein [Clostridium botulinum C/D]MCD3212548.1 hypothetical protein [Clostridium botulinum C/D]MCD3215424.1 hypothetical protein [Clostridium botulinum C/D]MCD3229295.1 hypothetical protein [Clostridium botulinum C/D]
MKKISKIILSAFLCTLAFSISSFASEVRTNTDKINVSQNSENIRLITKEQYCKSIAKSRGISVKEVEKITNEIIANHKNSISQMDELSVSRSMRWGTTEPDGKGGYYNFGWVYKRVDAGGGMIVEASVPVIIYNYHSYAKEFIEVNVDDCYAHAVGSGSYTYQSFSAKAKLMNNKVHLNATGAVQIQTNVAKNIGISIPELASWGFSVSQDHYARKTITISHVESLY